MSSELLRWFVPTSYGDIRLHRVESQQTRMELTRLTRAEVEAVRALRSHSLKRRGWLRRSWAEEGAWQHVSWEPFSGGLPVHVDLKAPIGEVERVLSRHLRSGHDTVNVVITREGRLYEIKVPDLEDEKTGALTNAVPFRRAGDQEMPPQDPEPERPVAAVTVARPRLGCPAPHFARARVRAAEVLRAFLTPEQIEDFERHQRFVTVGAESGHRYMITSRHARSSLDRFHRTVYDLERGLPLCVHDWSIPAAEEMLTMHLLLSLPGWENYVASLPDGERTVTLGPGGLGDSRPTRPPSSPLLLMEDGSLGVRP